MPVHPVVVDPRIPVVVGVDDPVSWRAGQAFPADLALLWPVAPSLVGVRSSAVGHDLTWSYTGNMYDADGVSVGANPPFHSGKGLYSGPAVTQMLKNSRFDGAVSGSPGTPPTNWSQIFTAPGSYVINGQALTMSATDGRTVFFQDFSAIASTVYYLQLSLVVTACSSALDEIAVVSGLPTGATLSRFVDGASALGSVVLTPGVHQLEFVISISATAGTPRVRFGVGCLSTGTAIVEFEKPMLSTVKTATYIATGPNETITQPSAAATTGGNGASIAMDRRILEALGGKDGAPAVCTVMHEAYMGVGSGDLAGSNYPYYILSPNTEAALFYFRGDAVADQSRIVAGFDGANYIGRIRTWSPNEIHRRYVQTNTTGTKFRVGAEQFSADMTPITNGIVWSHATADTGATFDGSFNPLQWLWFGLNLSVPVWHRKTWISQKCLSDTQIQARNNLVRY